MSKKLLRITINIDRESLASTALKSSAFVATRIREGIAEQLGDDWEYWYTSKMVQKDQYPIVESNGTQVDCLIEVTPIPELEEIEERWEFGV